ncbi:MAG: hypothetical protein HQ510_02985 [Candidatus Marinimicrobia bacterium]|nr:hypothetical protein [Candidatus Neomarinimicrobiota bacterium]
MLGCIERRAVTAPGYDIPEVQRPTVSHHVPLSNATNIDENTSVTTWFSELMDEESIHNHFSLYPLADLDSIQTIAIAYDNPEFIISGRTSLGVFKSEDNAESWYWQTSKTLRKTIWDIKISPQNSSIAYLATTAGVYLSTDSGSTWIPKNNDLADLFVRSLAIDPHDANIVYALTNSLGVFKSTNGGDTWLAKNTGVNLSRPLHEISISPVSSNNLFITTEGNFILRSVDAGEAWERLRSGLSVREFYAVSAHPLDTNLIFAGSFATGVFRSANNGDNWNNISTNLGNLTINAIAVDPTDTNTVYVGTAGGIYKTSNAGVMESGISSTVWSSLNPAWINTNIKTLIVHPSDEMLIFTCLQTDGFYRSIDGGENWIKRSNLVTDNILETGIINFEIWQDTTTVITPIDSLLSDTTIIHPYILSRALEGWDGDGDPPLDLNPTATKMIFDPDSSLITNCKYRIKLKGKFESDDITLQSNPSAVMDRNGNSLESDASYVFTTK